ncbi:MAG: penicillin-binding protein 2 [Eggerthellaceae bacterium]|nr:penicillin-binding protein 2 [Eggerthellaceae bacterium]
MSAVTTSILIVSAALAIGLVLWFILSRRSRKNKLNTSAYNATESSEATPRKDAPKVNKSKSRVEKPSESLRSRFLGFGGVVGAAFIGLVARLWSLQVINEQAYAKKASQNLQATAYTIAPRGCIYDTNGIGLVKNRAILTVLANADAAANLDTQRRLSAVLGIPLNIVRKRMKDTSTGSRDQRVVATDASFRDIAFITEHSSAFPGITVETRTVREYPYKGLAAHVLGYSGIASRADLESTYEGRDIKPNDLVGKSGIEAAYDGILSGDHGVRQMTVDALGNVLSVNSETQATKGSDVYLTINAFVQYVCDKALAATVAPKDETIGTGHGVAAAVVAMNVNDGSIIAMASYPTFDPSNFTNGISSDIWELYNKPESHAPLNNRVVNGMYGAASTFKAFTGLAGLEYGFATTEQSWKCSGKWDGFESGEIKNCWSSRGHGTLDFYRGVVVSCDVVFYDIAKEFYKASRTNGGNLSNTAIQEVLERYGFGRKTGIDLLGESSGRIPTPEWKAEYWRNVPSEAIWKGGDLTNIIIGQGDVLITPMQLAVAYGAIATGRVIKPHLLKEVHNAKDEVVITAKPEIVAIPKVETEHLEWMRQALRGVAVENSDIAKMFNKYGIAAACKTGTVEHTNKGDDGWFACYAPFNNPKYVVVAVVEEGGGGAAVAGPIATQVMDAVLRADDGSLDPYLSAIAGSKGKCLENLDTRTSGRTD